MKSFMLALLLLTSCSGWKQKDFEKSLDEPVKSDAADETVKDKELLEKFKVTEQEAVVEKPVEKTEVVSKPVVKNKTAKPLPEKEFNFKKSPAVTAPKEVVVPVPMVNALPKDYPEDLIAVNESAKKAWDQYTPNIKVGQKTFLDIHYLGMTVGKIMFVNKGKQMIAGKEVWHLHARFKSAPFYSNIYELDNTVDALVSTDKFLSAKYTLIQRESKQSIDDLQLFDRDQLKAFWYYKQKRPNGKIKNKDEKKHIPMYSVDPFSVIFFFQGLPLKDGDKYQIPLINKAKTLLLDAVVEGREVIDTEIGEKKAIRIRASTQYTGDHLKSGDMTLWFSDDADRKLLKASAKIKIGSVTADIVKD